jgi:segregation and condensation protein B
VDQNEIKYFVEAALLAAGKPLSIDQLQNLFDRDSAPDKTQIREAIGSLHEDYQVRGLTITEVASGFRTQIKASMADRLQKLWEERPPRYSRAFFETLALIAYRQPMTRGEIEEIRGVAVSANIMRSLLERDWIRVVGHRDVPGRPAMFGTTRHFLDYFGLKKLDDLPPLADLADWETLRVQLNLPDVSEEEAEPEAETAEITDLPVLLYPQGAQDEEEASDNGEPDEVEAQGEPEAPGEETTDASGTAGFEAIEATRWPGPVEILRVVPGDDAEDAAEDSAEDDVEDDLKDRDVLISGR